MLFNGIILIYTDNNRKVGTVQGYKARRRREHDGAKRGEEQGSSIDPGGRGNRKRSGRTGSKAWRRNLA